MSTQDPSQRPNLGKETSPWESPSPPAGQPASEPVGGQQPYQPPAGGQPTSQPAGGQPAYQPPAGEPTSSTGGEAAQPAAQQPPQPAGAYAAPPPDYGTPAAPPGYGGMPAQGYAPTPVGYGIQGKRRGPWVVWLLGLITLGIYFLVWYYKINNEARQYDPRIDVEPGISVLAMFPGSWIIVPPLISFYNTGKRIAQEQRAAGLPDTSNPWIGLILYVFVFGTGQIYYQYEINKVLDRYPGAEWGQQVPLYF